MVDFGRALLGGVQGLGQGLIEQNTVREKERVLKGAELRAEKRARMKANRDAKAQGIQNEFTAGENDKTRKSKESEGLLNRKHKSSEGALTRSSNLKVAGVKARAKAPKDGEITAGDKRTIDVIVKKNTEMGMVKSDKVVKQLAASGRADLAEFYAGEPVGKGGVTMTQAREQARREIKKGFADFGEPDKGTKDKREKRAKEIFAGGKPAVTPAAAKTATASTKPDPTSTNAVTDITGTRESQKTQLGKIVPGGRVRLNGKVYIKEAGGFREVTGK